MIRSPAGEAAKRFLDVVWTGEPPTDAELLAALDRLIAAYHDVPDVGPSADDMDAPGSDGQSLYAELGLRFPDYGYYPVSDSTGSPGDQKAAMVGDAIDDLLDLTLDMRRVVWLGEHVGADDANWSFRFLFSLHWGLHARNLSLYLHGREFG